MKNLPKRYVSEEAVKRALNIDSFRNLSKDKIMQFASMIPYMGKDVAIAIITQFPAYTDFGKIAVEHYSQICSNILENNKESQNAVITGYQTILDALSKRMEKEELTEQERSAITQDMIQVADKIAMADLNNKKFLDRMGNKIFLGVLGVVAVIGAGIGINSAVGNSSSLPEVQDDKDEN